MSIADPLQRDVAAFLSDPATWAGQPVERLETHGAVVFLAGEVACKMKRAVRFPYLDYSTLALREAACRQELAINRRTAPQLYRAVEAVTRDGAGGFRLGGHGEPVEWVVLMRRFPQEALLDGMAQRGEITPAHAVALADAVARFHAAAEPVAADARWGGAGSVRRTLADTLDAMEAEPDWFAPDRMAPIRDRATTVLEKVAPLLDSRRAGGYVRRCHGDLHLGNVCLLDGVPTPFDAIEFNDDFVWIDVLQDLAFLLMDMEHRGLRSLANLLFNRYFLRADAFDGVACLPLFLAERALVRAKVAPSAAAATPERSETLRSEAEAYLRAALAFLDPPEPRLVAVGGVSGTGKSTLAARLAPAIGAAPGAVHLRTDVLRKRMFGVAETDRLPEGAYTPEASRRVFAEMFRVAGTVLAGGHGVVVDGVFGDAWQRAGAAETARRAGVPFTPIWLEAPRTVLVARVAARTGDASDATPAVVERQLEADFQPDGWLRLTSEGSADAVAAAALKLLRNE